MELGRPAGASAVILTAAMDRWRDASKPAQPGRLCSIYRNARSHPSIMEWSRRACGLPVRGFFSGLLRKRLPAVRRAAFGVRAAIARREAFPAKRSRETHHRGRYGGPDRVVSPISKDTQGWRLVRMSINIRDLIKADS